MESGNWRNGLKKMNELSGESNRSFFLRPFLFCGLLTLLSQTSFIPVLSGPLRPMDQERPGVLATPRFFIRAEYTNNASSPSGVMLYSFS